MANYYVDPAAGGANNGSSWTDAWIDIASAFSTASASDSVYCRGTQALSAGKTQSTSGSAGSRIWFIGCNALGVEDGTTFKMNGQGLSFDGLAITSSWTGFRNFEVYNCDGAGIYAYGAASPNTRRIFKNIIVRDNTGTGFNSDAPNETSDYFESCQAYNNGYWGIVCVCAIMNACIAKDNTSANIVGTGTSSILLDCVAHNSVDGFGLGFAITLVGCVADGNSGIGISVSASEYGTTLIANRVTNNGTAIKVPNWGQCYENWTGFYNNSTKFDLVGELESGSDSDDLTSEGYVDRASDIFELTTSAEMRRIEVELD